MPSIPDLATRIDMAIAAGDFEKARDLAAELPSATDHLKAMERSFRASRCAAATNIPEIIPEE